jgi:hypothetical protein
MSAGRLEVGGATDASIAGGVGNAIQAVHTNGARSAFIGGGEGNLVTGSLAAIGGGYRNTSSGYASVVPGGYRNVASGDSSFAAGYESSASTPGSFVWSDYSPNAKALSSTKPNQFLARASGGVYFYSNSAAPETGVVLSAGSGSWASSSDRNIKHRIEPTCNRCLLASLDSLPIATWSYLSQFGVRHAGPMAHEFGSTFRLNMDSHYISTVDEDGVTLASVRASYYATNQLLKDDLALLNRIRRLATSIKRLRKVAVSDGI